MNGSDSELDDSDGETRDLVMVALGPWNNSLRLEGMYLQNKLALQRSSQNVIKEWSAK
jgi:hypothetical protein